MTIKPWVWGAIAACVVLGQFLPNRKAEERASDEARQCSPNLYSAEVVAKCLARLRAPPGPPGSIQRVFVKGMAPDIGMNTYQVRQFSSWGNPESINTTRTAAGTREQWVYSGNHRYLYFTDDVLTGIQE